MLEVTSAIFFYLVRTNWRLVRTRSTYELMRTSCYLVDTALARKDADVTAGPLYKGTYMVAPKWHCFCWTP